MRSTVVQGEVIMWRRHRSTRVSSLRPQPSATSLVEGVGYFELQDSVEEHHIQPRGLPALLLWAICPWSRPFIKHVEDRRAESAVSDRGVWR